MSETERPEAAGPEADERAAEDEGVAVGEADDEAPEAGGEDDGSAEDDDEASEDGDEAQVERPPAMPTLPGAPGWQTQPLLTALGILANIVASNVVGLVGSTAFSTAFSVAFSAFAIWYTLVAYRSRFTARPVIRSVYVVSFLNGFVGHVVGLLWNRSLTKGDPGVSHLLWACLWAASLVLTVMALFA